MREFLTGVRMLGRGLALWRRIPGTMALGLVPAAIVGIVLFAGLIALSLQLPSLAELVTPFADGWGSGRAFCVSPSERRCSAPRSC